MKKRTILFFLIGTVFIGTLSAQAKPSERIMQIFKEKTGSEMWASSPELSSILQYLDEQQGIQDYADSNGVDVDEKN